MKKTFIYDKIYKSEMQKTTNTNLAKYFSLAIIVYLGLNLTSCASGYFCTLNSRGEIPSDKTYYIVSVDSTETQFLIVICIVYQHITYPYIKNSSTNSNLVDYAI